MFRGLFSIMFTFVLWGAVLAAGAFGYVWFTLDQKGLFQIPAREPGIMLLASNGDVLAERGAFFGDEVRVDELPAYVLQAVIAIEDRRFKSHFGVDPVGLIRAMLENARAGRVVQGGSTLTQQLAKNLFLKPERTMSRKAQEAVLALWLEQNFSKDEILQLYLNRVYYGAGATGIEKAAQKFFGKSARDVTLPEAAILAAVLKAPSDYNPVSHPDAANARAALVISEMVEAGFITREEADLAVSNTVEIKPADYVPATQYIVDYAGEVLPQLVKQYDESIVVWTTIDGETQARAEKALRDRLNDEGAKLGASQGALVTIDTGGAIKAMVGGKSYAKSQFNRVTKAKRQPGSAFKPFVYLAALEQGFSPESMETDGPIRIGDWEPENYRDKYLGPVTLTKALALSLNTVAARLVMQVTPEAVISVAHRLGITSALTNNASIALGTSEVTLLELTSSFVPFANGGAPVEPYLVSRITTRSGEVLYERTGDGFGQAVTGYDLGSLNLMMRAVVTEGTARRAQFGEFEIAGKTGTSQDYRDAWFIGYTSYLVTGVWVGNDDNSPTKKITGGSIPTAIWKDVMEPAHSGLIPMPLPGDRDDGYGAMAGGQDYDYQTSTAEEPEHESRGIFESLFGSSKRQKSNSGRKDSSGGSSFDAVKGRAANR
jgi:penicillin-binding protein 1A